MEPLISLEITKRDARRMIAGDDEKSIPMEGVAALLRKTVPRRLDGAPDPSKAPLEPRDAFVLALVDGRTTIGMLVDITTMEEPELLAIVNRLRRLRLISLG